MPALLLHCANRVHSRTQVRILLSEEMERNNPRRPARSTRRRRWQEASSSVQRSDAPPHPMDQLCVPKAITFRIFLGGASTVLILYLLVTTNQSRSPTYRSHQIPILIPSLIHSDTDNNINGNIGGWFVGSPLRFLPDMIRESNQLVDTGGLIFLPLDKDQFRRTIRKYDETLFHEEIKVRLHHMDAEHISKRHWYADELEDVHAECRRPSWENLHFPTCLSFHEVDLSRPYDAELAKRSGDEQDGNSYYLSHGYFRDVFALSQPIEDSKAVLKVARYTKHEMNYRPMFNARRGELFRILPLFFNPAKNHQGRDLPFARCPDYGTTECLA